MAGKSSHKMSSDLCTLCGMQASMYIHGPPERLKKAGIPIWSNLLCRKPVVNTKMLQGKVYFMAEPNLEVGERSGPDQKQGSLL